jgi:hypothetical protein
VISLYSCDPLAYSDNERAKQLLYDLDDHVWGMKITALEESRKGCPNHDTSLTSEAFIISTRIGGHDANPTNPTVSSVLEFALSSLVTASDE